MRVKERLREAFQNLYIGKLRSILAILGILVGTASVVAMVSVGQLVARQALLEFKALGTDLLSVSFSNTEGSPATVKLNVDVVLNIKKVLPDILQVAPYTNSYSQLRFAGHQIDGGTIGVTESFFDITKLAKVSGRFIYYIDGFSPFCVVGNDIYKQMMKYSPPPYIGKQIQIGNDICTVVGIGGPWLENNFIYVNLNRSVFIPIRASLLFSKYADIDNVVMRLRPDVNIDDIEKRISSYFAKVAPYKKLFFNSARELIASMEKQQRILTLFLGIIGGISLLVGGIGVMNIMLVSVTERKREIGIRLAIGAKRRDIQELFLIEAVMLTVLGGFMGILLGVLSSYIVSAFNHWQFAVFFTPIIIGFSVSVFTGVFFGFYPAYQASQLNPIDTLRSD